jgi:hypothetical protein
MREFNLEQALAGHPVCTRDGREVTQLVKFDINDFPLAGIVCGDFYRWKRSGKAGLYDLHYMDLFMAPVKKTGWVARYAHDDGTTYINTTIFKDKAACVACCGDALSYHEISWEE